MTKRPRLQLSRLRDIGWSKWDPIGLLFEGGAWIDQEFADEYDSYLLDAAARLRNGCSVDEATDYLKNIEICHMGMSETAATIPRAQATAQAIRTYLDDLDASA